MSKQRKITQKYIFCIFMEGGEENKTVVPSRWVVKPRKTLWWPNGTNLLRKQFCDPDENWNRYELVKVLVEGEKELCEEMMTHTSSESETDTNKLKKQAPSLKVPPKPTISLQSLISKQPSPVSPYRKSTTPEQRSFRRSRSSSASLSPPPNDGCRSTQLSSSSHSRGSRRATSPSNSQTIPSTSRRDSVKLVKNKFLMEQGEFQRRVLTLLTDGAQRNCHCPCTCGQQGNGADEELQKLATIEEISSLDEKIKNNIEYNKLVSQLKKLGGRNMKDNVKNIMYRLMDVTFMGSFNMKGKNRGDGKKIGFENYRVCDAIVESIQDVHKSSTVNDIKVAIGNVLKFSPFLNGGAKRKRAQGKDKDDEDQP